MARHDELHNVLCVMARYDSLHYEGTDSGRAAILDAFIRSTTADGSRTVAVAEGEFDRSVNAAHREIAKTEPTAAHNPGCDCGYKLDVSWAVPTQTPRSTTMQPGQQPSTLNPNSTVANATPWPTPQALTKPVAEVPDFPVDAFPPSIAEFARSAADALQVPVEAPLMAAIGAYSAATNGNIIVQLHSGREEKTNLFLVTSLKSGEGKSPTYKIMMQPVHDYETDLVQLTKKKRQEQEGAKRAAKVALSKAEKQGDAGAIQEAYSNYLKLEVDPAPRILIDDVTPEAFQQILSDHKRITGATAEGGPFDNFKSGTGSDVVKLDPILKSWSGDSFRVDRKTSDPLIVEDATAVFMYFVQPTTLDRMFSDDQFGGRGLLQRFCYAVPESRIGKRNFRNPPKLDAGLKDAYDTHLTGIFQVFFTVDSPNRLTLAEAASQRFSEWSQSLEDNLLTDVPDFASFVAKLTASTLRFAGVLWAMERSAGGDSSSTISDDQMERAIRVGDYWLATARQLCTPNTGRTPATNTPGLESFRDRLISREGKSVGGRAKFDLAAFTTRHIARTGDRPAATEIRRNLDALVTAGWVRQTSEDLWSFHPTIREDEECDVVVDVPISQQSVAMPPSESRNALGRRPIAPQSFLLDEPMTNCHGQ